MVHGPSKEDEKRFQAEGDLRTLVESEKIKRDPERLAAAKKMAKEQRTALDKVGKA